MKNLVSFLRKYPHLVKVPLCLDLYRYTLLPHPSKFTRRTTFKFLNHNDTGCTFYSFLRKFTKEVKHLQVVPFYSNRNTFEVEAPTGIFKEAQNSFHLDSLKGCLGQSFNQLSRHIKVYFKGVVPENACLTTQEYLGRSQRRSQSRWADREQNTSKAKCTDKQDSSGTSPSAQKNSGLQLFHISSLVTRFGESYSYVAHHINSIFSLELEKVKIQENLKSMPFTRGKNRGQKRRKMQNTAQFGAEQAPLESNNISSSWEQGYCHFPRHTNKCFHANFENKVQSRREQLQKEENSMYKNHFSTQPTSQTQGALSQLKQEEPIIPEPEGLFHSRHGTTNFGENHFQMASHINQYFKGQRGPSEEIDRNLLKEMGPGSATSERLKTVTIMDCLRHPTSAIPDLLGGYLKLGPLTQTGEPKPAITSLEAILNKKVVLSRRQAEKMTHALTVSLELASSPEALTTCIESLNEHLIRYPSCKALMWQNKAVVTLLRKRRTYRDNQALLSVLRETLALIGYVDPVKGCGIRVLSIDGGGTRGVVPLQVLKLLEDKTGRKIHQLFDYICGVSTGAVLAFMLGLARFSLEECAEMYRRFGSEVFHQNRLVGTVKMGWTHSYYDTETWETILREKLGNRLLIKTARDELSPKVSAVSAVVNWGTSPKAFVFRNYNHKPGCLSHYAGSSGYQMWQAVRASSAAPGYFQEFPLQSDVHQDGGIILNNPCALAVHESRLLWPNQPFQCVLSLGTGRNDIVKRGPATSTSLRAKISNLINSATDTEGVHTLLDDLLAPDVYFRFNPMLSSVVSLDENRPWALDQLQRDTMTYLERNHPKMASLCVVLGAERSAVSRTKDWMSERAWEIKQRWM